MARATASLGSAAVLLPLQGGSPPQPKAAAKGGHGTGRKAPADDVVQLHPGLWLGHQLGRPADHTVPTGFAALDAELPGGGWPCRGLTELLLPQPGMGEIRLLAHSLAAVQQAGRLVMLFDPPAGLSAAAWARLGLDVPELLLIQTRPAGTPPSGASGGPGKNNRASAPGRDLDRNSLWALEQALKSGHVGAVLAWMPPLLRTEHLRRLQLAAQAHDGPAFLLRPWSGQEAGVHAQPTPSPLRLGLRPVAAGTGASTGTAPDAVAGREQLAVQLLKRRGPPRLQPLVLNLPSVLAAPGALRLPQAPALSVSAMPRPATFVNLA